MLETMRTEDLYRELEAGKLVKAYQQTMKAVEVQGGKIEEYPYTQYTTDNAEALTATSRALAAIGNEIRAWHEFLHPR